MRAAALMLLFAFAIATAPMAASAFDTVTFGLRVISVGDNIAKVYDVAGQPNRIVQLENKYGAGVGERLEYFVGTKLVQITIANGRVVRIDEIR
jgi:hypothetical protein